jgi:hypothetical protein
MDEIKSSIRIEFMDKTGLVAVTQHPDHDDICQTLELTMEDIEDIISYALRLKKIASRKDFQ